MYYIVYGIFYVLSFLPFRVLFFISDLLYFPLYYIIGYRREVVSKNLLIAFPEKSEKERTSIAKQFYHNLLDSFIEYIKLLTISEKQLKKRCSFNLALISEQAAKGKNIQLMAGHQFGMEFFNLLLSSEIKQVSFAVMYLPLSNKIFEKIIYKMRVRFGSILIGATKLRDEKQKLSGKQYALALIADQSPGNIHSAFWMNFFNRPVPFLPGAAIRAVRNNTAVIFVNSIRVKRGYYHFELSLLTENAAISTAEEGTKQYRDFVEKVIRQQPANYLWTHRRWKHEYRKEFKGRWIESEPAQFSPFPY